MSSCKRNATALVCLCREDGTSQTAVAHYTYGDADDRTRLIETVYTDASGNVVYPATEYVTVNPGPCEQEKPIRAGEPVCVQVTDGGSVSYQWAVPLGTTDKNGVCTTSFLDAQTMCPFTESATIRPANDLVGAENGGSFGFQQTGPSGSRDLENPPGGAYSYNPGFDVIPAEGSYAVYAGNPGDWHTAGYLNPNIRGHDTGADNDAYLIVNGATEIATFFTDTIAVPPDTLSRVSFWTARWAPTGAPGNLSMGLTVTITGVQSGTVLATQDSDRVGNVLEWRQTAVEFDTGINTQVIMTLSNYSTDFGGNELMLDDISFTLLESPCLARGQ